MAAENKEAKEQSRTGLIQVRNWTLTLPGLYLALGTPKWSYLPKI